MTETLFPHDLSVDPQYHVLSAGLWNYKAATDIKFDLGRRLHVFVGDNGAGKTTILDGIAAGLASLAAAGGAETSGAERVALRAETLQRKDGQTASQAGLTIQLGAGWNFDVWDAARGGIQPTEGDAAAWFQERWAESPADPTAYLPVFAYYTADRAARFSSNADRRAEAVPQRRGALRGAFSAATSYPELVAWFAVMERFELYEMRRQKNTDYRDPIVEAVRKAVRSVVPAVAELSFDPRAGNLQAEVVGQAGKNRFTLDEISGGGRVMVALVADIARRMIQANPHLGLMSPAVILIDEIDLHLHPTWQATVIDDLMRTFPKAQFLVTTHSEQVIGAVPTEIVRAVRVEPEGIALFSLRPSEGATYDRILKDEMGLGRRRNATHQALLDDYWRLVDAGSGEGDDALARRHQLDELFHGQEPELARADIVIRRLRAQKGST